MDEQKSASWPIDPARTPHHYHFQVFALDSMLEAPIGADRATLLRALSGHVIAKGEVMGSYAQSVEQKR